MPGAPWMLLFDIDGTLIRCGGAGRSALNRAFEERLGQPDALASIRLDGSTDPRIVDDGFRAVRGRPASPEELDQVMARYLELLASEIEAAKERYVVLAGVRERLAALASEGQHLLGLATGNYERGARIKLEPGGLNSYFDFGGFGSDAAERSLLVARGIERGQAQALARYGAPIPLERVWVFGDTEHDVTAAHKAGARAAGVLAAAGHPDALRSANPDLLLETLADPAFAQVFR